MSERMRKKEKEGWASHGVSDYMTTEYAFFLSKIEGIDENCDYNREHGLPLKRGQAEGF